MAMICTKICGFVNDASQTWIYELKFEGEDSQRKIRGQLFADKYSRTKNWEEDLQTKIYGRFTDSRTKIRRRRFMDEVLLRIADEDLRQQIPTYLEVQVPAGVMRLTTVNGQNRAAFVDIKRNMRKCNCHASVTLIASILSLAIILRITTKSQSSKNKSSARLRAPRLSEPMTAADRAVVALRTRRHNRSK